MNLLTSIVNSAGALGVYDQVLAVAQNNVANASTPGYVKQRQSLEAMPFDPSMGSAGGVRAGEVQSARAEFAEQAVRRQTTQLGEATQSVNSLTSLEGILRVTDGAGIPAAFDNLFAAFSAWGQSPTDTVARQQVLERATDVAQAFQQTAAALSDLQQDTDRQLQMTVTQINDLAGQLADCNREIMAGARTDSGWNARMNAALESLSQYGEVSALWQPDGTVSVLLNGQTPLVMADRQYGIAISYQQPANPAYPGARPSAVLVAADGKDITATAASGQLGSLLKMRNVTLASYLGDSSQVGDLNRMAAQFADRVNTLLQQGVIAGTDPAQNGKPIFLYDSANPSNAAETLRVDASVQPDDLGAADSGTPLSANAIPLALAALASPQHDADRIDGNSYSEFYGDMAGRVGRALNDATTTQQTQQATAAQAKDLRQQMSGVSLDEEAAILIQFQRGYEANSRLITILNQLTQDLMDMMR